MLDVVVDGATTSLSTHPPRHLRLLCMHLSHLAFRGLPPGMFLRKKLCQLLLILQFLLQQMRCSCRLVSNLESRKGGTFVTGVFLINWQGNVRKKVNVAEFANAAFREYGVEGTLVEVGIPMNVDG